MVLKSRILDTEQFCLYIENLLYGKLAKFQIIIFHQCIILITMLRAQGKII